MFCSFSHAQERIGVLRMEIPENKPVTRQLIDTIQSRLSRIAGVEHSTYSLDDETLNFHSSLSSSSNEQVVRKVLFYEFDLYEYYKPKLTIDRDNEGKIKWVGFVLKKGALVKSKMVDLENNTTCITDYQETEDAMPFGLDYKNAHRIELSDYSSRFSGDPTALHKRNASLYKERLDRAYRDLSSKFRNFYRLKMGYVYKSILKTELKYFVPGPMICENIVLEKEKAKQMTIALPVKTKLPGGMSLRIFTLDTIGEFVVPELFGFYSIDDVQDGSITLNSNLFSKSKKVGEAHLAGKPLYASFNSSGYGCKLNQQHEFIKIGLSFGKRSIDEFEAGVSSFRNLMLIDLDFAPLVDLFRERFKQEKFINSDFTPKSIGAKYLLNKDKDVVSLVDVATGEVIFNYNTPEGVKGLMDQTMGVFNQEIEIIKVTKEKKGKVKKVLLYSPFGFSGSSNYVVYKATYEEVNGKKLMRPIEIGQCNLYGSDGVVVLESSVGGDDGEMYNAIQNNEEIFLRNITYRLFGWEFK